MQREPARSASCAVAAGIDSALLPEDKVSAAFEVRFGLESVICI